MKSELQKAIDKIEPFKLSSVGELVQYLKANFDDDADLSINLKIGNVCDVVSVWGVDGFCMIETGNERVRDK